MYSFLKGWIFPDVKWKMCFSIWFEKAFWLKSFFIYAFYGGLKESSHSHEWFCSTLEECVVCSCRCPVVYNRQYSCFLHIFNVLQAAFCSKLALKWEDYRLNSQFSFWHLVFEEMFQFRRIKWCIEKISQIGIEWSVYDKVSTLWKQTFLNLNDRMIMV